MPKSRYGSQKNWLIAEVKKVIATFFAQNPKKRLAIMIATFFLVAISETIKTNFPNSEVLDIVSGLT